MQSLLLREALVLMFGSEFAWSVVLFAWLLGVAVGGVVGGWMAQRLRGVDVWLVAVLLALGVATCAELWVFRGARGWLGVQPGEFLPLPKTAMAAVLFVSPASALVGMAFPLACSLRDKERGGRAGAGPLGHVYAWESAGSLVGGAAFSFWAVEHLAPIQMILICGAIAAAAAGGLLAGTRRKLYPSVCLVAAAAALLAAVFWGEAIDRRLVLRRWHDVAPGYELCAEVESKYQSLAVGGREGQFTLYSDGQVSVDFPDPYTFVPLAHFCMCQHPSPQRVLVLGGAAEGLLAEILRYPIEHVDYVEPDPRQIELIEPFLEDVDRLALANPRVTVHHLDARYFVKTQRDKFDLVIARLPDPTSALRARFYTDEFYGELRRAMTAESVLCMSAAAMPAELSAESAEYLASIRATLRLHFAQVTVGWGDPAQVLAATEAGLVTIDPAEQIRRYTAHGAQSKLFHPLWFEGATDWLVPDKLHQRAAELDAVEGVEISTDLRPSVYMQRLVLWECMTSGQSGRVIAGLRSVGWFELVVVLAAAGAVILLGCGLRAWTRRGSEVAVSYPWVSQGAIVLSVGTTGFVTMALSIIWLFAFQNLYGYVYQRIGWIIAIFMGGLVAGCWLVMVRSKRLAEGRELSAYLWRWLITVDVLLALLALLVPFVLPALGTVQGGRLSFVLVEWAVSIMVAVTGVLGGAAFALAGGLQMAAYRRAGAAAGNVVGADHAGACLGALLTGLLLVPVFGIAAAAFLLAGIKLCSAALLGVGRLASRSGITQVENDPGHPPA